MLTCYEQTIVNLRKYSHDSFTRSIQGKNNAPQCYKEEEKEEKNTHSLSLLSNNNSPCNGS